MNNLIKKFFFKNEEKVICLTVFGMICGYIGSRIQAYRSRRGIIKVMRYYEGECNKIEDPIKRDSERHKVNEMISWTIRKCLWGPNSK